MNEEEARRIGFPKEWLPTDLNVQEACTQRCVDCNTVIQVHPDAHWRATLHKLRCQDCGEKARLLLACTYFDAFYVM